ncbi:hypothetical protein SISNIDRAFT_330357 [Sistotremastrum niveocremeum HHB9708]|uniref:DNA polymerase delta subunit 3 n=2 Tax=Sistotremastraceae TaxID=3402574 RepID=A0A164XFS7_9AGAM|nr:hypothetical protein SISNIDRAFT_330357 [Sistotremastrum niveocremeum HHB9708]KZT41343.1 hypothetical protein SISSUDRAFT_302209 [Sistotremastrum suecicum HHB10207 ss-3]
MSLTSIEEYLTKELVIEHNVVTFRLLSRTQGIHVNKAKKELQAFYETARTQPNNTLEATYLVSGETLPWHAPRYHSHFVNQDKEDEMEIDEKEDESIPRFEMIVTPEKHLEAVKGRFTKISAIHIYSLSPSRIIDPTFLVPPTETVRQIDQSKGEALARKVGRVVAPPIKGAPKHSKPVLGKTAPVAAIKQGTTSQKASPAPDKPVKTEEVTKSAPPAKSKAQSSLNWSKAKKPEPKETAPAPQVKVEEVATLEEDRNSKPAEEVPVKAVPVKEPLKEVKAQKVRTKSPTPPRKASPQPNPPPKPDAAGPRIRKGRVVSDSEDEVPVPKRGKKRKSDILSKESDTERSLRAMMDIDDEEDRASI